jgi:hypothetical protein
MLQKYYNYNVCQNTNIYMYTKLERFELYEDIHTAFRGVL